MFVNGTPLEGVAGAEWIAMLYTAHLSAAQSLVAPASRDATSTAC